MFRFVYALMVLCGLAALLLPATTFAQTELPEATTQAAGDGYWDDRFGFAGVEGKVTAIATAPDGNIYVGGEFTEAGGIEANHIARFDGKRWHALGAGLDDTPYAIAVDGKQVYVGGRYTTAGAIAAGGIARWNGSSWSTVGNGVGVVDDYFGSPEAGEIYTMVASAGKLYIGGDFVSVDGVAANAVAQWNGTQWSALGRGVGELNWEDTFVAEGEVRALALHNGNLYIGGSFMLAGEARANSVAMWNGNDWTALGSGMGWQDEYDNAQFGDIYALAFVGDSLYAGGIFPFAGGKAVANLARWDGNAWSAVGAGATGGATLSSDPPIRALLAVGNSLYLAGGFNRAGNKPLSLLARLENNSWSMVAGGVGGDDYDEAFALAAAADGTVYIGGKLRLAGGRRVDNIARLSNNTWNALGSGLGENEYGDSPANPYAIVIDGPRVFAAGDFQLAGGIKVNNIAMWDGTTWHDLGGTNGRVRALVVAGDNLYVGGEFTQVGNIGASYIARWNRTTGRWSALGSGMNGHVRALDYSNGVLYAGGAFSTAGNGPAYDLAAWNGSAWRAFGTKARIFEVGNSGNEVGTYVNALKVVDGRVFIAGHFQTIQFGENTGDLSSFVVVHNVVEYDPAGDRWFLLGTPLHPGVTFGGYSGLLTSASSLAVSRGGLFIGGNFNQAGALSAVGIARYDLTSGSWSALNGSLGGFDHPQVNGLAASGSDLLVAGKFTTAGTSAARFVARYDTRANKWFALGSGLKWYNDQYTEAYSVAAAPSGVYVGGDFSEAGGRSASGFARWGGPISNDPGTPPPPPPPPPPGKGVYLPLIRR